MAGLRERIKFALNGVRNFESNLGTIVINNQDVLLELNRSQILQGRNNQGELLTPNYQNDPYFKTPESAQRYAEFKERLISYHNSLIMYPLFTQKPSGTPNLIITGSFVFGMFITANKSSFMIDSLYMRADDINRKYGGKLYGLSAPMMAFFRENVLIPELRKTIYING